jgi:hypothetical protein
MYRVTLEYADHRVVTRVLSALQTLRTLSDLATGRIRSAEIALIDDLPDVVRETEEPKV